MFKDSVDVLIVRDLAMILSSFSGFLRYDEVSSLRFNDVKVHDNHLALHLEKSKTLFHASVFPGRPCRFMTDIITYIFVVEEIRL
jgi:hypothetical protein